MIKIQCRVQTVVELIIKLIFLIYDSGAKIHSRRNAHV